MLLIVDLLQRWEIYFLIAALGCPEASKALNLKLLQQVEALCVCVKGKAEL